ncbi:hypothetical protein HDV01_003105 [Terramyces sp. JEL0728]|nr:hypothetical protein HDV01_003105 [Terramyces sp. JEL0728]
MSKSSAGYKEHLDYVPYQQKRELKSGDQTVKDSIYSAYQMERIESMALAVPSNSLLLERYNERKALKELSQQRIKNWGNTVMGSRRKRLAATNERGRLLELERQKQDKEWVKVRETERKEAIERAKCLLRAEDTRVRSLHSQLLMSNVLQERDKQLQYKTRKGIAMKIHDKEETLKYRLKHLELIEKDKDEMEKQTNTNFSNDIRKELEEKAKKDRENKIMEANEVNHTLVGQINEKNAIKGDLQAKASELDAANTRFNNMKSMFADRKKQFAEQQASERMARYEVVAKLNVDANNEAAENRANLLEAVTNAQSGIVRQTRETDKSKKQYQEEQEEFLRIHNEKKQRVLDIAKDIKEKERARNIAQGEIWKQEKEAAEERKKKTLLDIKAHHIEQINFNTARKLEEKKKRLEQDALAKERSIKENADFEEYAAEMIREWKADGKNVAPVQSTLEKERRGYAKQKPALLKKEYDHFERLGFTVRWMPADPVLPPK